MVKIARRAQIRWHDEETTKLADRLVGYVLENPGVALGAETLMKVQDCLPPDRRRKIASLTQILPVQAALRERLMVMDKQAKRVVEPTEPEIVEIEVPQALDPGDIPTEVLLHELMDRSITAINALSASISMPPARSAYISTGKPLTAPEQKPLQTLRKKLRIAVVGLLPDQRTAVLSRINGDADLHFIDSDQSRTEFPQNIEVAVISRFCGHRWYTQARAKLGNNRVKFVGGGIDGVVNAVREFARGIPA